MPTKAKPKFSIYSTSDRSPMHFSGANGFPVGCYNTLLNALSQRYSITSLWHKGLWPNIGDPESSLSWDDYADDLISHIKSQHKQPIIGVGHSMGANITMIAAAKAPKLFSKLVLVEPVILSKFQTQLCKYAPKSWLQGQEPAKSALSKTFKWADKKSAFKDFKQNAAYKRIGNEQLEIMLDSMTDTNAGKTELTYPVDWEVANYLSGKHAFKDYQKLKVPFAVIRGKPSIFAHDKSWHKMMRAKPNALYLNELEFGHLMPFESPQITRQLILSAINKLDAEN